MRITRLFALSGIALSALVASAAAQDPVTISFLHKWPEPENMVYFEKAVAAFEEAHPNIDIAMEAVADEPYKDKIRVLMASGQVPDVFFSWSGEFGRKFARAGIALDLTDYVMGSDWKDRLPESALTPYELDGKLYGIPINVDAKYMVYNQAIFTEQGLTPPTSWDELIALCQKLKDAGITPIAFGNQFPWAASHYLGELNAKLVPNEVRLADYDLESPDETLFTDPGYVEALAAFASLEQNGFFNRGPNALTHAIARGSFTAGRTAMMYLELVEFGKQLADTPLEEAGWDFFTMPNFAEQKGPPGILTGAPDGFMVSAKSEHPAEAVEFLKFLTSVEEARDYSATTGMTSAVIGGVDPATVHPMMIKGLERLNEASALALWLDTDMDARVAEVYLAGSQAILNGTETPESVMAKVREAALAAKAARAG